MRSRPGGPGKAGGSAVTRRVVRRNKKAAAPVWSLQPRDLVFGPALPSGQVRETSDPILRTAGPPAHTHVRGEAGLAHGSGMVPDRATGRQPNPPNRNLAGGYDGSMTAIPARFRAYVAEKVDDGVQRGVRVSSPRPTCRRARSRSGSAGRASTTRMAWRPGRRQGRADQPAHPGDRPGRRGRRQRRIRPFDVGARVLAHGYELGVSRHGGYSSTSACRPAGSCRWRRAVAARGDGDRDGRVHRRDVRGRPSRSAASSPTRGRCS